MAHNPHLVQRLTGIQQALMAQYTAGRAMPNTTIGSERETFLREFLQKLFPAHRRFATGAITDSNSRLSGQVDIAVEYGLIPRRTPSSGGIRRIGNRGQIEPPSAMGTGLRHHTEDKNPSAKPKSNHSHQPRAEY